MVKEAHGPSSRDQIVRVHFLHVAVHSRHPAKESQSWSNTFMKGYILDWYLHGLVAMGELKVQYHLLHGTDE